MKLFTRSSFSFFLLLRPLRSEIDMANDMLGVQYVGDFVTHTLFHVSFYDELIETTVTSEADAVDAWINVIDNGIVSISAKYCRTTSYPVVLQFCRGKKCLIFQIYRRGSIPPSLEGLINNPNNIIVGVTTESIIQQLKGIYDLVVNDDLATVDIRDLLSDLGDVVRGWRIEKISRNILQKPYRTPKDINKRWTKTCLGNTKILFATVDAYATFLAASHLLVQV